MNNDTTITNMKEPLTKRTLAELNRQYEHCMEQIEDLVLELEVEEDPELQLDMQLSIELEELEMQILEKKIRAVQDKLAEYDLRARAEELA